MSSNMVFLLLAVAISVIGSTALWLRSRKPTGVGSSIDSFAREMQALAPDATNRAELPESGPRSVSGGTEPVGPLQVAPLPDQRPSRPRPSEER